MTYEVRMEQFAGPLDLLLQLIEAEKMDVTKVSLAKVADQYLSYINSATEINPEEMADFLVVAAQLILIKSKALLPDLEMEEEGDLEIQLKLYKEFLEASKKVESMIRKKKFGHGREKLPAEIAPSFNPPKKLATNKMAEIFQSILAKIEPLVHLPERVIKRIISLEEKIFNIRRTITEKIQATFNELVNREDKAEVIVSFLALLELVKQRNITLEQEERFGNIFIKKIQ
ncbi:MAG: segregation/condensation protein A [Patescibacteria group bacterium]